MIKQEMDVRFVFYEQIKRICKEKGITPSSMLSELNMSKGNLPNWKAGKKPSYDVLNKISQYLNVSVDELIGNEQKNTPANKAEVKFNRQIKLVLELYDTDLDFRKKLDNLLDEFRED